MGSGRAWYRARQLWKALRARVEEEDRVVVATFLTAPQQSLFYAMSPRDQRHSVETCRRLMLEGHRESDVLVAALLHDVGKGRIRLWHRVAYVMLGAAAPGLLRRLAARDGDGWRGALHRSLHHSGRGAEQALAAGASEESARLIRGHHDTGTGDERLRALIRADEDA
jgi:hypothetical protein